MACRLRVILWQFLKDGTYDGSTGRVRDQAVDIPVGRLGKPGSGDHRDDTYEKVNNEGEAHVGSPASNGNVAAVECTPSKGVPSHKISKVPCCALILMACLAVTSRSCAQAIQSLSGEKTRATVENTSLVVAPNHRSTPIMITRFAASLSAYSTMPLASSHDHILRNELKLRFPRRS